MKLLGISQRVDNVASYNERRDCLDQRWWQFGEKLGSILLPLPNISPDHVNELAASLNLQGIILSGGNTISTDGTLVADSAPERDDFERALIAWALKNNVPILGVCRGAQMLNLYFEGRQTKVEKHVAQEHSIKFSNDWADRHNRVVNSYHNYGILPDDLGPELMALATHDDGTIEAFSHVKYKICGIMWHPERENLINAEDLKILKDILL